MITTFEGVRYRIAFSHDPSTKIADHENHDVMIRPILRGAEVFCVKCMLSLKFPGHEGPRQSRCKIYYQDGADPNGKPIWTVIAEGTGTTFPGRKPRPQVLIYVSGKTPEGKQTKAEIRFGTMLPGIPPDQFCKETGRGVALRRAVKGLKPAGLVVHLVQTYLTRPRQKAQGQGA